jgi:hypothetical protein
VRLDSAIQSITLRLISPDKKDKSLPVFMEKAAKGVLLRRIELVPPPGAYTGITVVKMVS